MHTDDYQNVTKQTAIYPEDVAVEYTALGLNGEAGEVAEKVKKFKREGDEQYLEDLEAELGDVLWYLARLADELDLRLSDIAEANLDKLLDRQEREALEGEGDNR